MVVSFFRCNKYFAEFLKQWFMNGIRDFMNNPTMEVEVGSAGIYPKVSKPIL
jgi:hypothetical protein